MSREGVRLVAAIAEVSAAHAEQAGIGASEYAGTIVSTLAAHPHLVPRFLENPSGTIFDNLELMRPERGALSWLSQKGKVVKPQEMRMYLADNARKYPGRAARPSTGEDG